MMQCFGVDSIREQTKGNCNNHKDNNSLNNINNNRLHDYLISQTLAAYNGNCKLSATA